MIKIPEFRVWDKQRGQWFPLENSMCLVLNPKSTDLVFMTDKGPYIIPETDQPDGGINRFVIQQWIGISDRKRKKIFVGDFLQGESYEAPLQVVFERCGFGLKYANRTYFFSEIAPFVPAFYNMEVVGNIFDNPELLKNPMPEIIDICK